MMIARLLAASARRRIWILAAALLLLAAGTVAARHLARDAIPDLSDPQIVLVAEWMGHPAPQVAQAVTVPLQRALAGVTGARTVRGTSMAGMAYLDVVFDSTSQLARGRQQIAGAVAAMASQLPAGARINVGPLASASGWVFQYALVDHSQAQGAVALARWHDEALRPALLSIGGVAEVATIGAGREQLLVQPDVQALRARGLAMSDVISSLDQAVASTAAQPAGSDPLDRWRRTAIRAPAVSGAAVPPTLGELAHLRIASDMPSSVADFQGRLPVLGGIVVAKRDAALPALIEGVRRAVAQAHPPAGVEIVTIYDRLKLATQAEGTLLGALAEEIAVVCLAILIFLLHGRSALVPAVTLPVILALTFAGMWLLNIPATIMTLGGIGIALGLAVDADVIALEAAHRCLEAPTTSPAQRRARMIAAGAAVVPGVLTALLITAASFLPVLAFSGETGRLLRPLAVTKTLVIAATALVALTLSPAIRDLVMGRRVRRERDNPLVHRLVNIYRPFVHFALTRPLLTLVTAGLAVASCLPLLGNLRHEFLPRIDEGDLLFMPTTLPGASPEFVAKHLRQLDRSLATFPEVSAVLGKAGRADTATDPAPFSMAEIMVQLLPRDRWPLVHHPRWYSDWAPAKLRAVLGRVWPEEGPATTAELIARMDAATQLPGWINAWTAPARGRMDMMSTGVRTPVAIRIVSADPARRASLGAALAALANRAPGTRRAFTEGEAPDGDGEPWPQFTPDPTALAAAHVEAALARATAGRLLAGGVVGEYTGGGRRLPVRVEPDLGAGQRGWIDRVRDATVRPTPPAEAQGPVPLGILGRFTFRGQETAIRTEGAEEVAYVYVELDAATDLGRHVAALKAAFTQAMAAGELTLRPGERIEWAGQYALLESGQRRLKWISLAVLVLMFGLLVWQFRSVTEAIIVLAAVPFALVGSIWTVYLLGIPLSAPVWVGFLSVVGLAMQTGVVMVLYIDAAYLRRLAEGRIRTRADIVAAHMEGTVQRLRPKLMTVTTMAAGLLPLLSATGAGAEIMRRVAAPMLGGLVTSSVLTLEVLPVLYTIWRFGQLRGRAGPQCANSPDPPRCDILS